jgi:hypothetical protein
MIALAVVLLLIVVVFSVAVVISNPAIIDLSIFGAHVPVTAAGVYFNGAGAMLILVLALDLLRRGVRRQVRRRRREKSLRAVASGATRAPASDRADGSRLSPTAGFADAGESKRTPDHEPADAGGATRGRAGKSASVSADAENQETAASGADTRRTGPQEGEADPAGATALGSASLLERQALLEEAEELTGDDSRR